MTARGIQQGFTLIELVVVITILGVLAAFGIPRFAALDGAARVSASRTLAGSLRSAAALAHAQYLVAGNSPASVTIDGQAVSLAFGYPDAAGIALAVQDTTTGFTAATVGSTITFTKTAAVTPATCITSYTAAAAANTAPAIAGNTAGC